ncbi:MAG: amidohydrolase [Bacteroidota bacterium]
MKKLTTPLLLLLVCGFIPSHSPSQLQSLLEEDLPYLMDFYQERHQHPEIFLREKNTSQALARELRSIGFEVEEEFGGYGVVGILKNGKGPTILYRTDMDALPMVEKTELAYASKEEIDYNGIQTSAMHSCGHDMHMTVWLGTARAMAKLKKEWKGTLMFIGQPAEEIGQGAKLMLEAGLYETFGVPDKGIALHCSPTIPAGQVGFGKGYTMANAESIDIRVFGVGSHGATPHMSIDPVVTASMIVMELQTIVSRNLKPTDNAVITVGAIKGGTRHNIIPDEVSLQLTVRTFKQEVRDLIHKRIREIARGVGISVGLPEDKLPEVIIPNTYSPANYNDPQLVDLLSNSAKKVIGEDHVVGSEPQMVAEDFALYSRTEHKVPTALYWLGTVPEARMKEGFMPGLHSPFYYPDMEQSISTGVGVTTQALLDLLPKKKSN